MKVVKWLDDHFEETLLAMGLVVITLVFTMQIIFRKVFGNSLAWSEELCRYIFMWSGMLTLSYSLHNKTAIKTDLVINLFPIKVQKVINLMIQIMLLVLFTVMIKVTIDIVPTITQMGTAIPISRQLIFVSMPIGFGLAAIRTVQNIIKEFKNFKEMEESKC